MQSKSWNYVFVGVLALLVILALARRPSDGESAPTSPAVTSELALKAPAAETASSELDKARDDVVELFKSDKEPTAKDAVWTQHDVFKVGVINDGTDRSGYAEYVCNVLYDYGFKGRKVWVQVIDIVKLTRTNKWEKLGDAHCL